MNHHREILEERDRLLVLNAELVQMLKFAASIIGHPDDEGSKLIAAAVAKAKGVS